MVTQWFGETIEICSGAYNTKLIVNEAVIEANCRKF